MEELRVKGDNQACALSVINPKRKRLEGPALLHDLISRSSLDHLALDFLEADGKRVRLSYHHFLSKTHDLARQIRGNIPLEKRGCASIIIPVLIPQSPELYITWVAVLIAGAAFCPISPDLPTERLRFIVQDVDASLILTLPEYEANLRSVVPHIACLTVSQSSLNSDSRVATNVVRNPFFAASAQPPGLAYIMYTSGSTGLPKGVKVPHESVTQSLLAHDEHIPQFKRFLQFASPTFDVSIFETFFPFLRGATLVSCERERMLADLPGTINTLDADAAELTPTVASSLLRTKAAAPCLRTLLTIGEMLTRRVVDEFGGSPEQESMLYAMYGPTEASIHCTLAVRLAASSSTRSIGKPLATVTAYILNESASAKDSRALPVGEIGELAVSGQLASGYINRPKETMDAFVDIPGLGLVYRTGDRAVLSDTGDLEILGRISAGQVKLRGQRVELGEIEEVACKTFGVNMAVASVVDDVLVLFCATGHDVERGDIQSTCKSWLPRFMRPGEILTLQGELPQLPSGKIDRRALEMLYRSQKSVVKEGRDVAPDDAPDDMEAKIIEVFRQELHSSISSNTSLWSSGLDSLRAIKVASRLCKDLYPVSAASILESETVRDLANHIRRTKDSSVNDVRSMATILPPDWDIVRTRTYSKLQTQDLYEAVDRLLPCSSMQVAMLAETTAGRALNFNEITIELADGVDEEDVVNAFRLIAQQNEILRSGFVPTDEPDMPFVQIVWKALDESHDLSLTHPLQITAGDHGNRKQIQIGIHHALYDGWSWDLIVDDLNAILAGASPRKRPSYSLFSSHQRQEMKQKCNNDRNYWQSLMQGVAPTEFPSLCAHEHDLSSRHHTSRTLTTTYEQLSQFANHTRLSRQTIIQTAWALLLSSFLDSMEPCFGIVLSGRERQIPAIDEIIGPCLSTFPLRIELASVRTIHDLLQHVQRLYSDCLAHSNISLSDIKKTANVSADGKLFDTLCVWQESYSQNPQARNFVRTTHTYDSLDYALILEIEPTSEQLVARITYDGQIPGDHANLILGQLDSLVEIILRSSDSSLDSIWTGIVDKYMSIENAQYKAFNGSFELWSTIEHLSREDPARVAISLVEDFTPETRELQTSTLSYGDLYSLATSTASYLRGAYCMQPDDLVCVLLEKSHDLYIAILAVVLSGAGYMCIDPRTPTNRTDQILKEARCKITITDIERSQGLMSDNTCPVVLIDELHRQRKSGIRYKPPRTTGSHLAYAVFTSGSTGTPKGVLINRKNILSNIDSLSRIYPCNPETDCLLQACSPAFDVSVFEIFWTWHMGMALCTTRNDVLFRDVESFVDTTCVTHLSMTPSIAALLSPDNVPKVKVLVTAGETMNPKVFNHWSGRGLYQGYGPSETTNICNIRTKVAHRDAPNNVGPAFPNTSIFVCRKLKPQSRGKLTCSEFQPVPTGAVGEIWIGGEQIGRGYIDTELTERSFFNHDKYGRLYRSGDIGRLLADGSLVVLGREDDQVKLRGQRIELGDVNSALIRSRRVDDAFTLVVDEGTATARLVSFWTQGKQSMRHGKASNISDLFAELNRQLPSYMVPDTLVRLHGLPLTRQGKVDKSSLISEYRAINEQSVQEYSCQARSPGESEPIPEREAQIAQIVAEVTNVPSHAISRNTSFFRLGLDSISSIQLARRLRHENLGIIDVSTIMRNPTISRLAALSNGTSKPLQPNPASERLDAIFGPEWKVSIHKEYEALGLKVEQIMPCTPLQEVMLSSIEAVKSDTYCNFLLFKVNGDKFRLQEAWESMVKRHELLRTGFVMTDIVDVPYAQVVLKDFKLSFLRNGTATHTLSHEHDRLFLPPYDLRWKENESKHLLLEISIHHALYDAEAMSVLLQEVQSEYCNHHLPEVVPFTNYIRYMSSFRQQDLDDFWRSQLSDAKTCRLSTMLRSTTKSTSAGFSRTATATFPAPLVDLYERAKQSSTTIPILLQAAWARLLACYSRCGNVTFGNVFSGRNLPVEGIEHMVGPCFNTLPVHAKIPQYGSNNDLCRSLHSTNTGIIPYQTSSLRRILRQRSSSGDGLFDSLLLWQKEQEIELNNAVWTLEKDSGDMDFPLILEMVPSARDNIVTFKLHHKILDDDVAFQILRNYTEILLHTIQYPQGRALDFALIANDLPQLQAQDNALTINGVVGDGLHGPKDSPTVWSPSETRVREILAELAVTELSRIAKDTTIFRLGLDSINAVQLASRLRKQGYKISAADILEDPSVKQIATVCDSSTGSESSPQSAIDLVAFDKTHRSAVCIQHAIDDNAIVAVRPCTPTQAGILSQFVSSNGGVYLNSMHLHLNANIDLVKLHRVWIVAMHQHEMLRTGFQETYDYRYPFAMITYDGNFEKLPWFVENKQPDTIGGYKLGRDMLHKLHRPCWRLTISKSSGDKFLTLSMLHALYDAHSVAAILTDVAALYHGDCLAKPPSITAVTGVILRHASEQIEAKRFWEDAGRDHEMIRFPDMKIYHSSSEHFHFSSRKLSLSQGEVRRHCAQLNVSFQAVLAATWARLLGAYTGQSNVTFGVVLSGRVFEEEGQLNQAVFPCINTVACPVRISHDNITMLRTVAKRIAGLVKHQFTPMSFIKRCFGVQDELFDTVLVLQKFARQEKQHTLWKVVENNASAEYAVSLEIVPGEDDVYDVKLTYRENVLPIAAANVVLQQFEAMLQDMLFPDGHSDMLPSELLSCLPPKNDRIPTDIMFLHEFVEKNAAELSAKVALEFASTINEGIVQKRTWTYKQLDSEGSRVAHLLLQHGSRVADLVGICFDKCPEASFAVLGVLKAGCTYVAIDPGAPKARRDFIMSDAKCRVVLTTKDKIKSFVHLQDVHVLAVDDQNLLRNLSIGKPVLSRPLDARDTCYCLYTSGTTGTPKGCLISHESAVQAMLSFQRIFEGHWEDESRWLQFAAFHFDVSVLEQYWSWSVGICVTSAPRDLLFEDIPGAIRALNITHLDLTPSLASLLTPQDVPSLCKGVFIVGGEQVRQDILDTWGDVGCLYNFYGPSEVTIGCTVHPRVPKNAKPTNIGQQWDNVGSFVLEPESEKTVLRGAVGELCLSGPLVGKGYLNRHDLTMEKFVVLKEFNTRVYRTGDLVRLLHDASFEFLGRIDGQIKLRGQRLEVGEINHVILNAAQDVKDVATMVLKHPSQEKEQIVAFFCTSHRRSKSEAPVLVPTSQPLGIEDIIRRHCQENLPAYMTPTQLLRISSMPLSANNKVESKVLKMLYEQTRPGSSLLTYGEDGDSGESTASCAKVLKVLASFLSLSASDIEPTSRLFELGLDSISAISFSRLLRRQGFHSADVALVMRAPTLRDLAHALDTVQDSQQIAEGEVERATRMVERFASKHRSHASTLLDVPDSALSRIAPCTPLQQGMISKVMKSEPEDTVYFSAFNYVLDASIDIDRLQKAWKRVYQDLEILHTHFVETDDGFGQAAYRNGVAPLMRLQGHSESRGIQHILDECFHNWVSKAKSWGKRSPWQLLLLESGEKAYMCLQMFHGLYDGIGLHLLLDTVASIYKADNENESSEDPQFFDVLPLGPLRLKSDSKDFWVKKLPHIQLLDLPVLYSTGSEYVQPVSAHKLFSKAWITILSHKLNVTNTAVFHAAWLYALYTTFHINPTVGLIVSGRAIPIDGVENVIGPMFNTLPCAINKLNEGSTLADLVKTCHKFNVDALPHQHTALRDIAKWLGRDATQALFDSLFVFQQESSLDNQQALWTQVKSASRPDYPLNIEVEQRTDGTFVMTIFAKGEYLSESDVQRLLDELESALQRLVEAEEVVLPKDFCPSVDSVPTRANRTRVTQELVTSDRGVEWTQNACKIRDELAQLADVEPGSIGWTKPNIFELGLDSIDALKLGARLRKADIVVPISKIMRYPTVAGIVAQAEQNERPGIKNATHRLSEFSIANMQDEYRRVLEKQNFNLEDVETILPVTSMQEGLLVDYDKYYNVTIFELANGIDAQRLSRAWMQAVRRNPILRTKFVTIDDEESDINFLQIVEKLKNEPQPHLHTGGDSASEVAQRKREQVKNEGLSGQIVRVTLQDTGLPTLVVGMPHATYDAWSLALLHREVAKLYHDLSADDEESERAFLVPYESHLEKVLSTGQTKVARSFWKRCLRDPQPSIFTTVDGAEREQSPALLRQIPSTVALEHVQAYCKQHGITLQSLGLACWTLLVAHYTRQLDVCFGLILSGRTTDGSEQLVFPTFNTVVFRTAIESEINAAKLLKKVHTHATEVAEHQHFPLRAALNMSGDKRRYLFNTLFTFQKVPENDAGVQELYHEVDVAENSIHPPYPINVEMEGRHGRLWWTIACQEGVATAAGIEHVLSQLDAVLQFLIRDPEQKVLRHMNDEVSICGLPAITIKQSSGGEADEKDEIEDAQDEAWTETETAIRHVLAQVSKTEQANVKKDTGFFHLGLDSISAIRVASVLKKQGIKLPVSTIIQAQTVKRMAEAVAKTDETTQPQELATRGTSSETKQLIHNLRPDTSIADQDIQRILPVTSGQEYMLNAWATSGGRLVYATFWYEVKGVSKSGLQSALSKLVETVPMLRTTFVRTHQTQNHGILQVTLKPDSWSKYRTPWSAQIIETDTGLLVTLDIHHALYDAVSLRLMITSLEHLCQSEAKELTLNTDMASLVGVMQSTGDTAVAARQDFWTSYLGTHTTSLELLRRGTFQARRLERLEPDLLDATQLDRQCRRHGVSIQALFFAAYARVHARIVRLGRANEAADDDDDDAVVLGVYLANRSLDLDGVTELVAPTFSIVPLKVRVGSGSLLASATQVQRDLGAIGRAEHCGVTLREVLEWTGVKIDCFVNFLRLPGELERAVGSERERETKGVRITHAEGAGRKLADGMQGVGASPFAHDGSDEAAGCVDWCLVRSIFSRVFSGHGS